MWLLSESSPDILSALTQYGPLGLMVLGFVTGWIVPGPEAKSLQAEVTRLQHLIEGRILPIAEQYAVLSSETSATIDDATRVIEQQGRLVEQQGSLLAAQGEILRDATQVIRSQPRARSQ